MKKNALQSFCGSTLLGLVLIAPSAFAGDEAQQNQGTPTAISTTATSGIVSQAGPDSIAITTTTSATPLTYQSTQTTSYVDEAGNPVDLAAVKAGMPVTIYYSLSGTKRVAARVVLKETPGKPRG